MTISELTRSQGIQADNKDLSTIGQLCRQAWDKISQVPPGYSYEKHAGKKRRVNDFPYSFKSKMEEIIINYYSK